MNGKILTLLLVSFGLLLAGLFMHIADLAWMALPFLVYLGVGVLQAPAGEQVRLRAERRVEKHLTGEVPSVEVCVTVTNPGQQTVHLAIADELQSGMRITDGALRTLAVLPPGGAADLRYTFSAGRGMFFWHTVRVALGDPFGLIETRLDLPAEGRVYVLPELKKLRPFPLRLEHTLQTPGSIPARVAGSGTEFWGVREYQPGDPLRRLDWRRMARHPRQLFTREFEQEQIADIGLVVDARQKTDLGVGEESLFEHSIRAVAGLAEVFLRQGNRLSLLIYGKRYSSLFPGYGKEQLNRVLHTLSQAVPQPESSGEGLQFIPVNMFPSHCLIIVLSPLAQDDWRLFQRLRAYGYQALLISPDPIRFATRWLPSDHLTLLATRMAQVERHIQLSRITGMWIPVIDWQVGQPLAPLVRTALGRPPRALAARG